MDYKDDMGPVGKCKTVQSEGSKRKKVTKGSSDPAYKESVKVPPSKRVP